MYRQVKLGEICTMTSGGTPRRGVEGYYEGDIPWAKIGDLEITGDGNVSTTEEMITAKGLKAINNRIFEKGTLFLAMYGSVGKVAFASRQMSCNQAILGINPKRDALIDMKFLKYWFQHSQNKLIYGARGVALKNISATIVKNLQIPLPPLPIQQKIAAILDAADAYRQKTKALIEKYDQLTQSLFLEMFGDPVRNEKGWEIERLENLAEIVSGVTKGRKIDSNDFCEVPYMRVANVQDGYLNLAEVKTIPATESDLVKYSLIEGDILLTEGGDPDKLGRGAVWHQEINPCIHQNHIFRVRIHGNRITPIYLSKLCGSEYGKRYFLKSAKQTTGIASINKTQLRGFPVLMADPNTQRKFNDRFQCIQIQKSNLASSSQKSEELFQSLLQRAFKGELVV